MTTSTSPCSTELGLPEVRRVGSGELVRVARAIRHGAAVRDDASSVSQRAEEIVGDVRRDGDDALLRFVRELDGVPTLESAAALRFDVAAATPSTTPAFRDAVDRSIDAVRRFHEPQRKWTESYGLDLDGVWVEERVFPLRRVGLYVPGGKFPYPSTVIMSAVPAQVAGVEEIVVTTPPGALEASDELVYVLQRLGITEVWGMGGAHAVAALAYGTDTIAPVDLIAGPGNAWVSAGKRAVQHVVGIDKEAGPSEVVIVADETARADWIAMDLLAQAEHDERALSVLVTPSNDLAASVRAELEKQLDDLPTAAVARASLSGRGALLVTETLEDAVELAEHLAAEHQQLMGTAAEAVADHVRSAGALFIGSATPTCFGDYAAGPSHVLPTGGTARFSSGLSVMDFLRRSHRVRAGVDASRRLAATVRDFAAVEGLEAHRRSASARARNGTSADTSACRENDRE